MSLTSKRKSKAKLNTLGFDPALLAEFLVDKFSETEIGKEINKIDWTKYQNDPEGFCVKELDMHVTSDMRKIMDSVLKYRITVAVSANAVGKSLPVETKVMTPKGYKEIGSLKINDFVIGKNGKKTKVIGVYPQGLQPTYRVSFNDQTSILCSEDHLWSARSSSQQGRNQPFQTYTTKELIDVQHRSMNIPMCEPIEFKKKDFIIDPYVMGILLGDGSLTTAVRLTSADKEIVDEVSDRVEGICNVIKYYNKFSYGITTERGKENLILNEFRRYGLIGLKSDKKFIPKDYLLGSIEQRKDLLAGLLDSDGYVSKKSAIQISTSSSVMASQIKELVWSLGGTARQSIKNTFYKKDGILIKCLDANILTIKVDFNPFKLTRKIKRWVDPKIKGIRCSPHRKITNVEYVGVFDSVCIRVDAKDSLFVTEKCIVTHNSHMAGALALWFYRSFPGAQVITCAAPPERNLIENLWSKIRFFARQNPKLVEDDKVLSLKIMPKGAIDSEENSKVESTILGITIPSAGDPESQATRISGYHAPYQLFIFDEGDGVPDGIYKGAEGCLSGEFSRLLILFNPKMKSGAAYRMTKNEKLANVVYLSAFSHPNVITGEDIIPGAVSREKTVQRINDWTKPLRQGEIPDQVACFEVPDFLVGATAESGSGAKYPPLEAGWRRIEEACFSYIVLGRYPAQGSNQLISQEWIDAARSRWDLYTATYGSKTPEGVRPILGMDVADEGGDYNTVAASYGNYIAPLTKWRGLDVDLTSTRALILYSELHSQRINVESDGLGASVAPKMGRQFYWICPVCGKTTIEIHKPECSCKSIDGKIVDKDKYYINAQKISVGSLSSKKCELGQFGCLRDELWWTTREWLRSDQAMLPPDNDLIEELTIVTYGVVEGKIKIMPAKMIRQKLGRSADSASALIQTRYQGIGRPKISNLLED